MSILHRNVRFVLLSSKFCDKICLDFPQMFWLQINSVHMEGGHLNSMLLGPSSTFLDPLLMGRTPPDWLNYKTDYWDSSTLFAFLNPPTVGLLTPKNLFMKSDIISVDRWFDAAHLLAPNLNVCTCFRLALLFGPQYSSQGFGRPVDLQNVDISIWCTWCTNIWRV